MYGIRLVLAFVAGLGLALGANAHPGHGPDPASALHHLAEPVHALPVLAALALVGFGALRLVLRRARRPAVRSTRR